MAKKKNESSTTTSQVHASLPRTTLTGVSADPSNLKTVLISGIVEISGQVRFGDGTDIDTTVTETDMVLTPNGDSVHKFIWAGSKRRGVDRRIIHEIRNRYWQGQCYIPNLCGKCPVCWLYGFTGTTQKSEDIKEINAKSRILYATSVSIETVEQGQNRHHRNQVEEKKLTTAGEGGIHKEQVIVAGVHFPIHTACIQVLDWEIGAFAHALLEGINSDRYTAASRAQGGIRWATFEDGSPLLIVDESSDGVFPLAAPKLPGWETVFDRGKEKFTEAKAQEVKDTKIMVRYCGEKALGYLRQKQLAWQSYLQNLQYDNFNKEIMPFIQAIGGKTSKDKKSADVTGDSQQMATDNPDNTQEQKTED